jgi:hypothetical protein
MASRPKQAESTTELAVLLTAAFLMNLPQAEAEQNPAGTAAFCGRTRIIGNTDINKFTVATRTNHRRFTGLERDQRANGQMMGMSTKAVTATSSAKGEPARK